MTQEKHHNDGISSDARGREYVWGIVNLLQRLREDGRLRNPLRDRMRVLRDLADQATAGNTEAQKRLAEIDSRAAVDSVLFAVRVQIEEDKSGRFGPSAAIDQAEVDLGRELTAKERDYIRTGRVDE